MVIEVVGVVMVVISVAPVGAGVVCVVGGGVMGVVAAARLVVDGDGGGDGDGGMQGWAHKDFLPQVGDSGDSIGGSWVDGGCTLAVGDIVALPQRFQHFPGRVCC